MKNKKDKIIVILGPTASGKSELAVKLARKFNGEVVSADSRQIYKGLDIGSGKITKKEMKGIPHHCLDIVSSKKIFSVAEYKKCAEKAIEDILARGKTPIICGGTGLYIDTLLGKMTTANVPPNWKLRKELEKKSIEELFKMLKKLDPERAKNIDAKNPRRLTRAIEIALSNQKSKVKSQNCNSKVEIKENNTKYNVPARPGYDEVVANGQNTNYKFLQIGIRPPDEVLKKNIAKRIKKMLASGLIEETKNLHEPVAKGGFGLSWKRICEFGFEYKYPVMFLRGNFISSDCEMSVLEPSRSATARERPACSSKHRPRVEKQTFRNLNILNKLEQKMILENWHYVKRQMTWFKRDKRIEWFAPSAIEGLNAPDFRKAENLIKNFLK